MVRKALYMPARGDCGTISSLGREQTSTPGGAT